MFYYLHFYLDPHQIVLYIVTYFLKVCVPPASVELLAPNGQNTWMLMWSISETDRNHNCLFSRSSSACVRLLVTVYWTRRFSIGSCLHFSFPLVLICFPSGPARMSLHTAGGLQLFLSCRSPAVKLSELLSFDVKASRFSSGLLFTVSFDICQGLLTSVLSVCRLHLLFSVCWHLLFVFVFMSLRAARLCVTMSLHTLLIRAFTSFEQKSVFVDHF